MTLVYKMATLSERLETTIFRSDDKKTAISAIMNPGVKGGLGQVMFDIARDLAAERWGFRYTGKDIEWDEDYEGVHMSAETRVVRVEPCFNVFGGSAFQLHRENDASRFSHIVPGTHDVDMEAGVTVISEDDEHRIIHPFSDTSVDYHLRERPFDLQGQGVLPYILRKIQSIIHSRLTRSNPPRHYYRRTSDGTDEVKVLKAKKHTGALYQEVINDIFLLGVTIDETMVKIQVEVAAQLGETVVVDHVFELIIAIDNVKKQQCGDMDKIDGMFVKKKENLFWQNMTSAIERSYATKKQMSPSDIDTALGKCAQDVLRITYIILTELDKGGSWVNTPEMDGIYYLLPRGHESKVAAGRTMPYSHQQTPIEYFTQYMKHLAPCIERSNIGKFGLHEDHVVDFEKNHGAPIFLKEILELFTNFTVANKQGLVSTSDRVRDMGILRNRVVGPDSEVKRIGFGLPFWSNNVKGTEKRFGIEY